jgi:ABC-type multidrug transport system permease subunit
MGSASNYWQFLRLEVGGNLNKKVITPAQDFWQRQFADLRLYSLVISAFSNNKLQTILVGIFLNIPIILLGGAVTAINSMPLLFRWIAQINPLYHYLIILRGILLKGVGLEVWWMNAIAMILFATVMLLVSANRYRKQLS